MEEDKENAYACIWHNLEFAEVCAFYRQFHKKLRISEPNFNDLHDWLITCGQVPQELGVVHLVLLNLIRRRNSVRSGKCPTRRNTPWETRLKVYCKQMMPVFTNTVWQNEYAQLDVSARLVILRYLQDCTLRCCINYYPNELRDQYVGTDCFGMRYVMKLWPAANIKCWICFDLQSNVSQSRKRWRNRAEVDLLITYLERNLGKCPAKQKYEQQQMISFLNTLRWYFPVRLNL